MAAAPLARLSRNRVLDGVTAIPFAGGSPTGEPTPTPDARAPAAALVRARLTAAALRLLARGQLSVRLVATARAGDESVSRFTAATLLRPPA